MERYTSPSRLEAELRGLFRRLPLVLGRGSDLPERSTFFTHDGIRDLPIVVTRDAWGQVHAMVNLCRHRGVKLVLERAGTAQQFVCNQHAWTYDLCGRMTTLPLSRCDADQARDESALVLLPCEERHGFVWVTPSPRGAIDVAAYLGELDAELERLALEGREVVTRGRRVVQASWKLVMEACLAMTGGTAKGDHQRGSMGAMIFPSSLVVRTGNAISHVGLFPRTPETTLLEHTALEGSGIDALLDDLVAVAESMQRGLSGHVDAAEETIASTRLFHEAIDRTLAAHPRLF